jgi:hypothetical protein
VATAAKVLPATVRNRVAAYGQSGIISALQSLVQDLANTSSGTSGDSSSAAAAGSTQSTAALQSFLTNFVQDPQNNGADSLNSLGGVVNTTA